MLKKEKATEKKYTIYGEEYTTEELRSLSKNLPTGDKSMAEFNRHLKDGNIKEIIKLFKRNKLLK